MSIADTAYVAEVGSFFDKNDLTYLEAPLRRASRLVKRWVGATVYDAAVLAPTSDAGWAIKEAEALLAVREALPAANRSDTGKGITLTVETSSTEGYKTTRFMTPVEVTQEQTRLMGQALEQIRDYILAEYSGGVAPLHLDESGDREDMIEEMKIAFENEILTEFAEAE